MHILFSLDCFKSLKDIRTNLAGNNLISTPAKSFTKILFKLSLTKNKRLFICLSISFVIVAFQFTLKILQHTRLKNIGLIAKAQSIYRKGNSVDYVDISFVTERGEEIKTVQKCWRKTFDEQYAFMSVIYNPNNPAEFQNIYDYNRYSLVFSIIFFFVIYLAIITCFLYITHLGELVVGIGVFLKQRILR